MRIRERLPQLINDFLHLRHDIGRVRHRLPSERSDTIFRNKINKYSYLYKTTVCTSCGFVFDTVYAAVFGIDAA